MVKFLVFGVLSVAALLGAFVLEGGNPVALIGLSAAVNTVLAPWFAVLAVWSWKDWLGSWRHAFRPAESPQAAAVSVAIWRTSEYLCYAFAVLGVLLGLILILSHLSDTEAAVLGRALGTAILCPLYAGSFAVGCRLMRARVERLLSPPSGQGE